MLTRRVAISVVFLLAATAVGAGHGQAEARQAKPPAGARVAMSFTEFHGAQAAADYLRQVAAQHPRITELIEIGRSAGDRPIQVLVVSNMKTGVAIDSLVPLQNPRMPAVNNVAPMKPYMGKPGQWIDGGAHGLTLAGTEVCLYVVDRLVSGYGSDPEVTKLVDDNVFYICPVLYPDASPPGTPKLETPTPANGNFPEGWWTDDSKPGGTGTYPSSSAEARAVLEFFTNHTNILFVQSFHTNGGVALRPFARWADGRLDARDAAVFDKVLGKKYLELIGEAATSAWRSAYNQERRAAGGFGAFTDWAYGQFGAYAVSIQAWDPQHQTKPVPGDGLAEICERHWQFEKFKASLLPHVAITDATAKLLYTTNQAVRATGVQDGDAVIVKKAGAAPGRYRVVQITATVANTGGLPTQVAQGTQLRGNREDVVWLLGDRTRITFLDGTRWMRLGVLDGTTALPAASPVQGGPGARGGGGGGRGGGTAPATALAGLRVQRPEAAGVRQSGSQRVVSWLVAIDGDTPLKLAATSQKGGTVVRDVTIQ